MDQRKKFSYGKYEARVKIVKGKGLCPAFWTFGDTPGYNEIDVFEFWNGNTSKHNMTAHYNGNMCLKNYKGPDYAENFHVFTLIWEKDKMEWYVDGVRKRSDSKYYTLLGQQAGCEITEGELYMMNTVFPRDPMQVIFNVGVSSGDKAPDENTPFPGIMEIDYFRYYRR
ncbi:MAG: glycoside hydrolase family 16 protein [Bacteroidetes bacterium]|nr:glycoside hydrolase family 16 protein [Bacteroidota bacterium]